MKNIDKFEERQHVTTTVVMSIVALDATARRSSWQIMPKQLTDQTIRATS